MSKAKQLIERVVDGESPRKVLSEADAVNEGISLRGGAESFDSGYQYFVNTLIKKYAPSSYKKWFHKKNPHEALSGVANAGPILPERAKAIANEFSASLKKLDPEDEVSEYLKTLIKILRTKGAKQS